MIISLSLNGTELFVARESCRVKAVLTTYVPLRYLVTAPVKCLSEQKINGIILYGI